MSKDIKISAAVILGIGHEIKDGIVVTHEIILNKPEDKAFIQDAQELLKLHYPDKKKLMERKEPRIFGQI